MGGTGQFQDGAGAEIENAANLAEVPTIGADGREADDVGMVELVFFRLRQDFPLDISAVPLIASARSATPSTVANTNPLTRAFGLTAGRLPSPSCKEA